MSPLSLSPSVSCQQSQFIMILLCPALRRWWAAVKRLVVILLVVDISACSVCDDSRIRHISLLPGHELVTREANVRVCRQALPVESETNPRLISVPACLCFRYFNATVWNSSNVFDVNGKNGKKKQNSSKKPKLGSGFQYAYSIYCLFFSHRVGNTVGSHDDLILLVKVVRCRVVCVHCWRCLAPYHPKLPQTLMGSSTFFLSWPHALSILL